MDIKLNFINESNDAHNTQILFFSENVIAGHEAAAWTIIKNCGIGSNHPFVYPAESTIGYLDADGNHTRRLPANPGERFEALLVDSGDAIQSTGKAENPDAIELHNSLSGAITAQIFKASRAYSSVPDVAPGGTARFTLEPALWIGTLSHVTQVGGVSITVGQDNSKVSLLGIASADIVMTGGGAGDNPPPLVFTLQNIVEA